MLLSFWNASIFPSDEEEIFVKGQMIAQGKLLYTDIGTQHMPLMYYFAALFSLLGAESMISFRVCFYFLMAVLWGLMYIRYSDRFGKAVMTLYPCLYIFYIAWIDFGHCVLSEQLQGIGMAILFFELLLFYKNRSLKPGNMLMISLAVFLSFGSTFIAIFAIFFVWLTVFMLEARSCIREKNGFIKWIGFLIKKYWLLILIVALPFMVMLGYFVVVGSLKDFYGGAYLINRLIYPKYNNGYGENILSSIFNGISTLFTVLNPTEFNAKNICIAILALFCLIFIIRQYRQNRDMILSFGLVMLLMESATRSGFGNFHGLPAVAVACCMAAVCLTEEYHKLIHDETMVKRVCIIFCVMLISAKFMTGFTQVFQISLSEYEKTEEGSVLDMVTEDKERVGFSTLDYNVLMEARVLPASVYGGACAWLWEWYADQAMEELTSDPPRVFLYSPWLEVWGYSVSEYAVNLKEFIDDNYTSFNSLEYSNIYIRNDYYDEAVRKVDDSFVIAAGDPDHVTQNIIDGITVSQRFQAAADCTISSISFAVGTYARENTGELVFYLTDEGTGETILLNSISCGDLADNEYHSLDFDPQQLKEGKYYTITISSPESTEDDSVSLYYNGTADYDEEAYMMINGEMQKGRLCITIKKD